MIRASRTFWLAALGAGLTIGLAAAPAPPLAPSQTPTTGSDDTSIRPFRIQVPDAVLADLKARLRNPRIPPPLQGAGWQLGTDTAYLQELVTYWRDSFDWRAAVIAAVAAGLIFRLNAGVMKTLAVAAIAGLALGQLT